MARKKGSFPISSNFEVKIKGEFDARKYVASYADLLTFTQDEYIPYGFIVTCAGTDDVTKRGLYMCINEANLNLASSWYKITNNIPYNALLSTAGIVTSGLTVTVKAPTAWDINGVQYSKQTDTVFNISALPSGSTQIALIYGKTDNGIDIIYGNVSTGVAVEPNLPANTARIAPVYIQDNTIDPVVPDLSNYATIFYVDNLIAGLNIDQYAKLYGGNQFTGEQFFNASGYNSFISAGNIGTSDTTTFATAQFSPYQMGFEQNSVYARYGLNGIEVNGNGGFWTLNLPRTKSGTIALLSDIPTGSTSNLTFDNGLTRTDDNIQLGGDYEGAIVIGRINDGGLIQLANGSAGQGFAIYSKTTSDNVSSLISTGTVTYSDGGGGTSLILNSGIDGVTRNITLTGDISGRAQIGDDLTNKGIYYKGDYSVNWTEDDNAVLVNKGYVDNLIGGIPNLTFNNGLTKTGYVVGLGGDGDWQYTNYLVLGYNTDNSKPYLLLNKGAGLGVFSVNNSLGNATTIVSGDGNSAGNSQVGIEALNKESGNKLRALQISSSSSRKAIFTDEITNKGVYYANNYTTNWLLDGSDDRVLVDLGYVRNGFVTLATTQTISGAKSFQSLTSFFNTVDMRGTSSIRLYTSNSTTEPNADLNNSRIWFNNMGNSTNSAYRYVSLSSSGIGFATGGSTLLSGTFTMPTTAVNIALPNKSGTVALLSDITSGSTSNLIFENGLTKTDDTVKLGGILDESAYLFLNEASIFGTLGTKVGSGFIANYNIERSGTTIGNSAGLIVGTTNGNTIGRTTLSFLDNTVEGKILLKDYYSKGIEEDGDYSANKTDYSYITKKWALDTFGSGGSYTFQNGLTNDNGTVTLGGNYEGLIFIGDGSNGSILLSDNTSTFLGAKNGNTYAVGGNSDETGTTVQIRNLKDNKAQGILISSADDTPNRFHVIDELNSKGLEESGDYSANKTAYSYVTKQMLEDATGGGSSLIFNNGLTKTGDNIVLGGDYTDPIFIGSLGTKSTIVLATNLVGFSNPIGSTAGYVQSLPDEQSSSTNVRTELGVSNSSNNNSSIRFSSNPNVNNVILDEIHSKGIYYYSDYSPFWDDEDGNVLVTKAYVDSVAGGGSGGDYLLANPSTAQNANPSITGAYTAIGSANTYVYGGGIGFTNGSISPASALISFVAGSNQLQISPSSGFFVGDSSSTSVTVNPNRIQLLQNSKGFELKVDPLVDRIYSYTAPLKDGTLALLSDITDAGNNYVTVSGVTQTILTRKDFATTTGFQDITVGTNKGIYMEYGGVHNWRDTTNFSQGNTQIYLMGSDLVINKVGWRTSSGDTIPDGRILFQGSDIYDAMNKRFLKEGDITFENGLTNTNNVVTLGGIVDNAVLTPMNYIGAGISVVNTPLSAAPDLITSALSYTNPTFTKLANLSVNSKESDKNYISVGGSVQIPDNTPNPIGAFFNIGDDTTRPGHLYAGLTNVKHSGSSVIAGSVGVYKDDFSSEVESIAIQLSVTEIGSNIDRTLHIPQDPSGKAFFNDSITGKGLYYNDDYSGNWAEDDNLVLVNKGYVDNLVGDGSVWDFEDIPNWPLAPYFLNPNLTNHTFDWTPNPSEPGDYDEFEYRLMNVYNGQFTEYRDFTSGNTENVEVTYQNENFETITADGFRTTDTQYAADAVFGVESWTGVGIRRKATSTVEAGEETSIGVF